VFGVLLAASAVAAQAQTWTQGQAQWDASLCNSCHANNSRPLTWMQANYATNTAALNALNNAIATQSPMLAFQNSLNSSQRANLAAFISNWRAEPNAAPLTSTTLQANTETTVRMYNNGKISLQIAANGGIVLTGANANQFNVRGIGNTCFSLLVAPGSSCDVAVRYQPTGAASASHTATLTFTHNGEPQTQSMVPFSGAVAAPAPSPAPSPSSSDGGGGSVPLEIWASLLPAALLGRRRRR
jgi:cytochrome c553